MHAMRGISAHSNGFHTCRIIHILQIILGTIDVPGGSRYKPPFPKAIPPNVKPAGKLGTLGGNLTVQYSPLVSVCQPDALKGTLTASFCRQLVLGGHTRGRNKSRPLCGIRVPRGLGLAL